MPENERISSTGYKVMLFAAAFIWGAAFVVMKNAVEVLSPAQLVGIRFTLAGILMTMIFYKKVRTILNPGGIRAGLVMGTILFTAFWLQTLGLTATTPGVNAFLTATYCVMVPFLTWIIYRKFPGAKRLLAALICLIGIGLVSVQPGTFVIGWGDGITLLSAVVFGFEIIAISYFTKNYDPIAITCLQFITCGVLGLFFGFVFDPLPDWSAAFAPELLWQMAYLILLPSCVCYIFQNVGLAHVPESQGALILSLESVFGVLCSVVMYGEVLTGQMILGFALIFVAILISELSSKRET